MADALFDALGWFERFMEAMSSGPVWWAYFLLALVLPPLATVVHEAGHALMARRYGLPIRAFVAAPEGPALTLRRDNLVLRVGLGLGRDLRSKEPEGWVLLELPALAPERAIAILRAGPLAEADFGALVIVLAALPQPWPTRIILVLNGIAMLASARVNLTDRSHPYSDGSQIQRIREHGRQQSPAVSRPAADDPLASTSTAPPGY